MAISLHLVSEPDTRTQINDVLEEAYQIRVKDIDTAIHLASDSLRKARELQEEELIARASNYLGLFYMITGNSPKAIQLAENARRYYSQEVGTPGEAFALYTMGSVYYKTAHHEKGLELLFDSLEIWRSLGDKLNQSRTLKAIGYIYEIFSDYDNAVKNYLECLELSHEVGDKNSESNACNPLSGIYLKQGKLEEAIALVHRSIQLKQDTGDLRGLGFSYYGMGKVLFEQKRYDEAESFFIKSLHIHYEMGEILGEGLAKRKLGQVFLAKGQLESAERHTKMALKIGEGLGSNDIIYEAYHQLYLIAKERGDETSALRYFEMFHYTKESVLSVEISGKVKAREAIHASELAIKQAELERIKRVELRNAHEEIASQHEEITQSIRYAQRIQQAILPTPSRWYSEFPNSFALFKPRDLVSGDFYWMKRNGEKVLFSVVDCTGHGVPGALVSMVGYNGLNQLVERLGITKPAQILDKLCLFVKLAFKSEELKIQDGMDMGICCFNKYDFTLEFAGANNPMYLVRNRELIEYKGDKQPIGHHPDLQPFQNQVIQLQDGDRIYLMSDGYADQFGGPELKKFKSKTLKQMLIDSSHLSMKDQCTLLETEFLNWKGPYFQIDDVCVLGIEFRR